MALMRGSANPLNALGIRRLNHIPPHFGKITSKRIGMIEYLNHWIYTRLESRYCIKKITVVNEENKVVEALEIGVEDAKELSILSLGCPYI